MWGTPFVNVVGNAKQHPWKTPAAVAAVAAVLTCSHEIIFLWSKKGDTKLDICIFPRTYVDAALPS